MSHSQRKYNPRPKSKQPKNGGVLIPFILLEDETLTATEKLLFSYFYSFQHNGERCWISSEKMGIRLGIGWRSAKRGLSSLLKRKYIYRIKWDYEGKIFNAYECISLDWVKMAQELRALGQNVPDFGPKWHSLLGQKGTYNNNPNNKDNNKASPILSDKGKEFAERMGIDKDKLQ